VTLIADHPSRHPQQAVRDNEDYRLYRAQARSFARQAALARRAAGRDEFLELSRLWSELADEAERVARARALAVAAKSP
jgi:hypothetical protein